MRFEVTKEFYFHIKWMFIQCLWLLLNIKTSCNDNTNSKIKLVHVSHFMFIFGIIFYLNIKYILSLWIFLWFVEKVMGNNISRHVEIWNIWVNFLQFLSFRENMYSHNLQDITVYTPGTLRRIKTSKHLKRFRKI